MCVHCLDNGLGVTGSADDILSVFMITEMVRSVANAMQLLYITYKGCIIYIASPQNLQTCSYFYKWNLT